MKKKLLITGFDPFGGESVNPAFEAVRLLPDEIAGFKLCKLEIPTEFIRSGVIHPRLITHGLSVFTPINVYPHLCLVAHLRGMLIPQISLANSLVYSTVIIW